jgi:hypothetical protein
MGESGLGKSEKPRQVIHRGRGARNSLSNHHPRRDHLAACRFGHVDKYWDPGAKNGSERGKTGRRGAMSGKGKATEGEGAGCKRESAARNGAMATGRERAVLREVACRGETTR